MKCIGFVQQAVEKSINGKSDWHYQMSSSDKQQITMNTSSYSVDFRILPQANKQGQLFFIISCFRSLEKTQLTVKHWSCTSREFSPDRAVYKISGTRLSFIFLLHITVLGNSWPWPYKSITLSWQCRWELGKHFLKTHQRLLFYTLHPNYTCSLVEAKIPFSKFLLSDMRWLIHLHFTGCDLTANATVTL